MMDHEHMGEDGKPSFRFNVVKVSLNKSGELNRCKLIRMDVDVLWEKKCWDQAWTSRGVLERDEEADLSNKTQEKRRRVEEGVSKKRRKREEGSAVCGESVSSRDQQRRPFLQE